MKKGKLVAVVPCPRCDLPIADFPESLVDAPCAQCGQLYRIERLDDGSYRILTLRADAQPEDVIATVSDEGRYEAGGLGEPERRKRIFKRSALLALLPSLLATLVTMSGELLVLGTPILIGLTYLGLNRFETKRRRVGPADRTRAARTQELLQAKVDLLAARDGGGPNPTHRLKIEAITALMEKMAAVDTEVYAGRIAVLRRAQALVQQRIDLGDQLQSAYNKALAIIDIEIESLKLDAALAASTVDLTTQFDELARLRDTLAILEAELAANQEVERLLSEAT